MTVDVGMARGPVCCGHRVGAAGVTASPDAGALSARPGRVSGVDFADFFCAEHKQVIRFMVALGANGDDAADIAQAAFLKAFQQWDSIHCPRAWVRRVAMNELASSRRGSRREVPCETVPDSQVPASAALAVELREEGRQVIEALGTLPPKQRDVLAWRIDGFSAAEIAEELGVRPESVWQNLSKAKKKLRRFYESRRREG